MTLEEERDLYNKMKEGDDLARDDLIMGHDWLVEQMVRQYSKNADPDDIRQEARLALILVIDDRYDVNKGRLQNYAPKFMREAIGSYLTLQRHPIRLPYHVMKAVLSLIKIQDRLEQSLGYPPSYQEIKNDPQTKKEYEKFKEHWKMRITMDNYVSYLDHTEPVSSMQEDYGTFILEDTIPDPQSEDFTNRLGLEEINEKLLSCLTQQEQLILQMRSDGFKRKDICEALDLSTNRYDYLRRRSKQKIDKYLASNKDIRESLYEYTEVID